VNRPVLDFDSFMKLPGCTTGTHTAAKQAESDLRSPTVVAAQAAEAKAAAARQASGASVKVTSTTDSAGKETYSTGATPTTASTPKPTTQQAPIALPAPIPEDVDDLNAVVPPGTNCTRKGCETVFVSNEENRLGDGPGTVCVYHPAPPLFREGSKGYLCCKRRVLEFEEFLKIEGCKTGRHCFVKKTEDVPTQEEQVTCRLDHYQTPTEVRVSVFAKQADKGRSTVQFEEARVNLDIFLPGQKRFTRVIELFGPINPSASKFTFFGTKLELVLAKQDGRSWNLLEKTDIAVGNYNLTFGVSGRTGTVGAKEPVLAADNQVVAE